jgi:hypothetical protein
MLDFLGALPDETWGNLMVNLASNEDFEHMVQASMDLAIEHPEIQDWEGSPFEWILAVPPGTRGKVGRQLVAAWAKKSGFPVRMVTEDKQLYLQIGGQLVQVKMSTLWKSGIYRFQQIRDKDYDYCLCLGISPRDVHVWLLPKEALDLHVIGQLGQHTGADSLETYWFDAGPGAVQPWLEPYGNQLSDAREQLAAVI